MAGEAAMAMDVALRAWEGGSKLQYCMLVFLNRRVIVWSHLLKLSTSVAIAGRSSRQA